MRETELQKKIIDLICRRGGKAIAVGSPPLEFGTPDIIACYRGFMLLIEVKLPGQKPTKIQMKRIEQWNKAGARAGWVTDTETVSVWLQKLDAEVAGV